MEKSASPESLSFRIGQRVHAANDTRRIGTVKYIGEVEGYSGSWIGVDWDNDGDGKHDGSINGVRYFHARSERSGSFIRPHNLSSGISLLQALQLRYKSHSTREEEDEMYVFSSSNRRVSVELVGKEKIEDKLSRFEELTSASVSYLGVSSPGAPGEISNAVPSLKELDLTGNLISEWEDIGYIYEQLPSLIAVNLSNNLMVQNVTKLPQLKRIRVLVLNNARISWSQVEIIKHSLPEIEELHLMGNQISTIKLTSSSNVQGFDSLKLLNLEDNCIVDWNEVLKLSCLKSLEQLYLNKNKLSCIFYPDDNNLHDKSFLPFQNLQCLLLGSNKIEDPASIDSLNSFPKLIDIRLSDNPIADPRRGGIPRFILIARLAKVQILNSSEISARERKESEIRYIRLVMSKFNYNQEEVKRLHPRFAELKKFHGIEDERPSSGTAGPQKMSSGLLSITLKCVGPSIGEKPPLTKKIPATTTVGKLRILCESLFKLKSMKLKLFLQEEGSPLPTLLDDEMASLMEIGVGDQSTILVDEES